MLSTIKVILFMIVKLVFVMHVDKFMGLNIALIETSRNPTPKRAFLFDKDVVEV